MSKYKPSSFHLLVLQAAFLFLLLDSSAATGDSNSRSNVQQKRFIIFVRRPEGVFDPTKSGKREQNKAWHNSLLSTLTTDVIKVASDGAEETLRLHHSYSDVLSGFSASLTEIELDAMSKMDWFVNAIPDHTYKLHTTRTPEFIGLIHPDGGGLLLNDSKQGEGIIIGVIDTGIFPNHTSFSDRGLPPPPSKWKGKCVYGKPLCNNKLIGAQSFLSSEPVGVLPNDLVGHGTHTASTAAGAAVSNAAVFGSAAGTAVGMAPRAHIAVYKACKNSKCFASDLIAAMEAAIYDGVDILSLSIGLGMPSSFYKDVIAVGSFAAMSKGIFVSASAGNEGPVQGTVSNVAPWILTVAASTLDRRIVADVVLGNGEVLEGDSVTQFSDSFPAKNLVPLVFPGSNGDRQAAICNSSLTGFDVRGKVVLCLRGTGGSIMKGVKVKKAGGAAMILMNGENSGYLTPAEPHVLPASHISYEDGLKIVDYIKNANSPMARIAFRGTEIGTPFSPSIADFSSRGPSKISPGILKPDITGPGVSILAAWPEFARTTKKPTFNIISGTSMSCPHISGIAALIKAVHPDWSPAAVRSALMTTADLVDHSGKPISNEKRQPADLYALGAGHVNPEKAMNPGLVYDIGEEDYLRYLCGLNYNETKIAVIANHKVDCSVLGRIKEAELNYPSLSVKLRAFETVVVERTLTNVDERSQHYSAEIEPPEGVTIMVKPSVLTFTKLKEKKSFQITLSTSEQRSGTAKGYLKWVSGNLLVRSPISVTFN